ncbi:hypothetical protein K7X08_002653 [Anisodus acutangulus]|uniref:Uncharacterized protein n=1 Tax=Anisodus acutangulus TaxID=402998 RepID=A0A9Q1R6H3_9SOLA|nr:hypothetical protein K7X08_002653 [Anisodus acutangulus]
MNIKLVGSSVCNDSNECSLGPLGLIGSLLQLVLVFTDDSHPLRPAAGVPYSDFWQGILDFILEGKKAKRISDFSNPL